MVHMRNKIRTQYECPERDVNRMPDMRAERGAADGASPTPTPSYRRGPP
jgi:hypothetical protein